MNNPIKQLSLNLVYCNDITDLNALNDVNMYKLGILIIYIIIINNYYLYYLLL